MQCPTPMNGILQCPNGATGMYGDTCTFSCNPGYELQGTQTGTCLANQTWSGGLSSCVLQKCPVRILTSNASFVSVTNSTCTRTYSTQCTLSCPENFIGVDITYLCNVTSDPAVVDWIPIGGVHSACEKGLLLLYIHNNSLFTTIT